MVSQETWDPKQALRDPETLARLERNLRGAGMPRRTFLAMASAVAGTAALAACGGSSSPTATTAATVAATKPAAAASPAAACDNRTDDGSPPRQLPLARQLLRRDRLRALPQRRPTASTTAASSAATGAPTAAAATGPESKKVFIDGANITAEPVDNDFNRDLYCGGVAQHMSGLLQYDPDFNIQPDLAESFSNSGPVFTFKIRKGATWSDGQPITAKDFVYSIRRQIDPRTGNGYASFWDSVIKGAADFSGAKADAAAADLDKLAQAVGVKAVDDSTLEITGDVFAGLIPNQSAYTATVVSREDIVKKYADAKGVSSWTDPAKAGGPVLASGAFQITAWKHNQQIDLVRNDKYWNAKSIRQKYVTSVIIPDITKSTLPFENGDVDYQVIPATEVDRFKNNATLKSQAFPVRLSRHPLPRPGYRSSALRQARSAQGAILAIDKDRLVNQVGKKIHTPAYAMTAPGVFGFFDDDDNKLKNLQKYDQGRRWMPSKVRRSRAARTGRRSPSRTTPPTSTSPPATRTRSRASSRKA